MVVQAQCKAGYLFGREAEVRAGAHTLADLGYGFEALVQECPDIALVRLCLFFRIIPVDCVQGVAPYG
ncbi:MAG: hypothetical protein C4576_34845 [Desulfobacteraceae bacterium]|nr:MAG: hypothetical protein C4576_34845 [Desulfobacteraceae bacterium]